jgi:hypothetical protein
MFPSLSAGLPRRDGPHEGEDARQYAVPGEVVLAEPDVLDAQPVRCLDLLQGVAEGPLGGHVLVLSDGVKHSESHFQLLLNKPTAAS